MKELPCKELHCELLARLRIGVSPQSVTYMPEQIKYLAEELATWFDRQGTSPENALAIMEFTKSVIWEAIAKNN